jgi:Uma2 family endonuclease
MSRVSSLAEIEYPESDGRPMGETDLHRWWMIQIYDLLKNRYRDQDVYVGSDLLLYYVEGDPKQFVVPDDFVVLGAKSEFRRTFKTWIERRVPNVVIEVTSRRTRQKDQRTKPKVYAQIGVQELFLYDPTLDYLSPALQGYRLKEGAFVPLTPNRGGALECRELGLWLRLDRERLIIQDAKTGLPLLTEAEAERDRAETAEARAKAAELEVEFLREKLKQQPPE